MLVFVSHFSCRPRAFTNCMREGDWTADAHSFLRSALQMNVFEVRRGCDTSHVLVSGLSKHGFIDGSGMSLWFTFAAWGLIGIPLRC